MTTITPPLKWHGGKSYLAPKLIPLVPEHTHCVETYFGGGSFTLAKDPEGVSEVVNDINLELTTFWQVLQSVDLFPAFSHVVQSMPFSSVEYDSANVRAYTGLPTVDTAIRFFVRCRQSLAGRMDSFAPLSRNRTRRGMNEQASAWMNCTDGLAMVHARLRRIVILNMHAPKLIKQQDGAKTFFYCDPTYVPETRASTGEYAHEMTVDNHVELLDTLVGIEGKFMLSGYDSELYRRYESKHHWKRHTFDLPNNSAGGETKRRMQEIIWCNYIAGASV